VVAAELTGGCLATGRLRGQTERGTGRVAAVQHTALSVWWVHPFINTSGSLEHNSHTTRVNYCDLLAKIIHSYTTDEWLHPCHIKYEIWANTTSAKGNTLQ
jgi:hypothetical protein